MNYIRSLGITSVELLPIHTFFDESHLHDLRLTNYWGYNSLGFFAPDPRYAAEPKEALREFKDHGRALPRSLHRSDPRRGL